MSIEVSQLASAESKLTAVVTLAASIDGIDIVVGAHEGLVYVVEAPNPKMATYAEELASLSTSYIEAMRAGTVVEKTSIVVASYKNRALLVAELGDGYTVAILGHYGAVSSLLAPLRRIIEGSPLRCPRCGVLLEVYSQPCPRCGRKIPFGVKSCPFCGAELTVKKCPHCGTYLRLIDERLEPSEAPETIPRMEGEKRREEEAIPAPVKLPSSIGLGISLLGTVVYLMLVAVFKLPWEGALVSGLLPLAINYILSLAKCL